MSDTGRKDFTTQAKEQAIPDESKSTSQKFKESITGKGDNVAANAQPDSQKSTTQKVFDKVRGE